MALKTTERSIVIFAISMFLLGMTSCSQTPEQLHSRFIKAIVTKDYDAIAACIQKGVNVDAVDAPASGNTPLMIAVASGDERLVKLLIAAGANPDCYGSAPGCKPSTPRTFATIQGSICANPLLDHALTNVVDYSWAKRAGYGQYIKDAETLRQYRRVSEIIMALPKPIIKTDLAFQLDGKFNFAGVSSVQGGSTYNPNGERFNPPVPLDGLIKSFTLNGVEILIYTNVVKEGRIRTRDFGEIEVFIKGMTSEGMIYEYHAFPDDVRKIKEAYTGEQLKITVSKINQTKIIDDDSWKILSEHLIDVLRGKAPANTEIVQTTSIKNANGGIIGFEIEAVDKSATPGDAVNAFKEKLVDPEVRDIMAEYSSIKLTSLSPPQSSPEGKLCVKFKFECKFRSVLDNKAKDAALAEYQRRKNAKSGVVNSRLAWESIVLSAIGGPQGHRLAIINQHTFGAGDEGELKTYGGPVKLQCVEIHDDSVVVRIEGVEGDKVLHLKSPQGK